jgi:hypothetical protein
VRRTQTLTAAAILLAATACSTPAPGGPDDTPPTFRVEFFGLPPGPGETAAPSPNDFRNNLPLSQRAELGQAYQIVATLEDPDSGVEFLEVSDGKPEAECWLPGRTTIDARGPLLPPTTPGQTRRNPDTTGSPSPGPTEPTAATALPIRRAVSLEVRTDVAGGCPAGKELRWTITLSFRGVNGVGQPPRGASLRTPAPGSPAGEAVWGLTSLDIIRAA